MRPVSQAELARLARVSEMAISKAVRAQLKPAVSGRRVDLDHPATVKYLAGKAGRPPRTSKATPQPNTRPGAPSSANRAKGPGKDGAPPPDPNAEDTKSVRVVSYVLENVDALGELTIREVVKRFGTAQGFRDWLQALKQIEDTREKRLRNEETAGRLISRELVETHVFGAIDATNRRLLSDLPKTIARRLSSLAKGGSSTEDAEHIVRELISSQLKPVKTQAAKALRNA